MTLFENAVLLAVAPRASVHPVDVTNRVFGETWSYDDHDRVQAALEALEAAGHLYRTVDNWYVAREREPLLRVLCAAFDNSDLPAIELARVAAFLSEAGATVVPALVEVRRRPQEVPA